jgi:formylglycine-generating enzyme required for sulfatase activity
VTSSPDDTEIPGDGDACTADVCAGGVASHDSLTGTPCDDGGVVCDAGLCVECLSGADCASLVCHDGACLPAECGDGAPNGGETDVDCGGPDCPPCAEGGACMSGSDCASDACVGALCQAPSCADLAVNGGETGVDCGGPDCAPCADGQGCSSGADCQGGACQSGACQTPPSCTGGAGADTTCGLFADTPCCAAEVVPGGTYHRLNNFVYPATVDAFRMDVLEVTVGRFRAFVEAGQGTQANAPPAGSGAYPPVANSGWDPADDAYLPLDTAALLAEVACAPPMGTWTAAAGPSEEKPMNCLSWPLAYAFCIWDGGRLPTEAEWNFAAAGGAEQRRYPRGDDAPDANHAIYDCKADGDAGNHGNCTPLDVFPVGSKPLGLGRWGHLDLAGSVAEWARDFYAPVYQPPVCDECVNLSGSAARVLRGESYEGHESNIELSLDRLGAAAAPPLIHPNYGVRCVRAL